MTTSLVTGAGGFIGRNLVGKLASQNREVIALVHRESGRELFDSLGIEVLAADIRDTSKYSTAVARADEIYHLASVLGPRDRSTAWRINVLGTRLLAQCIAKTGTPGDLIYVSSLAASGPCINEKPRRETDHSNPVSIYGQTKLAAEKALAAYRALLPISIVRPPSVFGAWDRNLLLMFKTIARKINLIGISRQFRYSFVHVDDLVQGLIATSEHGRRLGSANEDDQEGVYFIGGSDVLSLEQLGMMIADTLGSGHPHHITLPGSFASSVAHLSQWYGQVFGKRVFLNVDKMREMRAGSWVCDCSRATLQLGFSPEKSISERLDETCAWYRQHGWLPSK